MEERERCYSFILSRTPHEASPYYNKELATFYDRLPAWCQPWEWSANYCKKQWLSVLTEARRTSKQQLYTPSTQCQRIAMRAAHRCLRPSPHLMDILTPNLCCVKSVIKHCSYILYSKADYQSTADAYTDPVSYPPNVAWSITSSSSSSAY
jgi:hypothetical protein